MEIDRQRLHRAFNPRTVAVVGAKKAADYNWLRCMSAFQGKVFSVQIDPNEIPGILELGFPNYPSLLDIPEPVDYVVCAVPRAVALRIVQDCIKKDVGGVTLYTSGFAETDTEEGLRLQNIIAETAKTAGLPLVGPNCMGIYNPKIGLRFSAEQPHGVGGSLAFISQSGTQAAGFVIEAHATGLGVSKVVSYGNGAVLDSPDYLEYFGDDDEIKVIGLYIEGVRDGRRFYRTLRDVAQRKPVVIWKGGVTEESSKAAHSHSGSLAVPLAVWDALLRQCGAVQVHGMEEMIDTVKGLIFTPGVTGKRLGLIAVSGGHSVEIADAFSRDGFQVPRLSEESYERLAAFYSIIGGSYQNPLEGGGNWASEDNVIMVLDILEKDENINAVVIELGTGGGMRRDPEAFNRRLDTISDFRRGAKKPIWAVHGGGMVRGDPAVIQMANLRLQGEGIPGFASFARAARALKHVVEFHRSRLVMGDP